MPPLTGEEQLIGTGRRGPMQLGVRTQDGWDYVPAPAPGADVWTRSVAPFGKLTVYRAGQSWDVVWHPADTLVRYTVAGPFGLADAAKDVALRWLFDSWSAIESQIDIEAEPVVQVPTWWLWVGLALVMMIVVAVVKGLERLF